jgi:OsmC subfamily peroxiredoxin
MSILPYAAQRASGKDLGMQQNSQIRIDVLLFDGFDELDAIGPYEVLRNAFDDVTLTSLGGPERITAAHGAVFQTERQPGEQIDWLIVPGGGWTRRPAKGAWAEAQRGDLPALIRSRHQSGAAIASVCSGALLLAAAGLLDGQSATTHADDIADLRRTGAQIIDGARVVDNGNIITSAGVTSGLDLALWLVERLAGPAVAAAVSKETEYERRFHVWTTERPEPARPDSLVASTGSAAPRPNDRGHPSGYGARSGAAVRHTTGERGLNEGRNEMASRTGSAIWTGDLATGSGQLTVGESAWTSAYSGSSRLHGVLPGFDEGPGTNPEELLAAAHAACFNMALSFALTEAGFEPPRSLGTRARVHLRYLNGAPTIQQIDLETEGDVEGIDDASFRERAEEARTGCIVSRALAGVEQVTVAARLRSKAPGAYATP